MYAVNIQDGSRVWSINLNAAVVSSPALSSDETVLYIGSVSGMYALNTTTGRMVWYARINSAILGGPLVDVSGNVYVSAENGLFYVR